jgi:hypothetical protein
MKTCTKCKVAQPNEHFRKDKSRKDGLHSHCKSCFNKQMSDYYAKNPDKCKAIANKAYVKNKHKHILRRKVYSWNKTYGIDITHNVYLQMLEKQEHKCAICLTLDTNFDKLLSVDHCHTTGKVRGLLCNNCNLALGNFNDNVNSLENAIKYLKNE